MPVQAAVPARSARSEGAWSATGSSPCCSACWHHGCATWSTVVEIAPSRQTTPLLDRLGARRRISLDAGYDARDVDALASIDRLPLRDGSVDLLVYHVLEHVPDDREAMREIARVLSPRGLALLEVPIRWASRPRRI